MTFNLTVTTLEVKIGSNIALTSPTSDGKRWTILFEGIQDGLYDVTVSANGKLLSIEALTIQPAISNSGGDLDW